MEREEHGGLNERSIDVTGKPNELADASPVVQLPFLLPPGSPDVN